MENSAEKKPTISYELACIGCDEHYYTPQKAIDELELPQTPLDVAIKESFTWLQKNNYCETN